MAYLEMCTAKTAFEIPYGYLIHVLGDRGKKLTVFGCQSVSGLVKSLHSG